VETKTKNKEGLLGKMKGTWEGGSSRKGRAREACTEKKLNENFHVKF
jgi:hypothetical protein